MSSRELVDELFGIVTKTDDVGVKRRHCDLCKPGQGHNTPDELGAEIIVSAEFLPEDSAFNTALRSGDSSPSEYREGRIINELALGRADGHGYTPDLWRSHAEIAAEKVHDDWQKRRHDENLAQLRGERR